MSFGGWKEENLPLVLETSNARLGFSLGNQCAHYLIQFIQPFRKLITQLPGWAACKSACLWQAELGTVEGQLFHTSHFT